jgi:hypothetical protein
MEKELSTSNLIWGIFLIITSILDFIQIKRLLGLNSGILKYDETLNLTK